ncbi:MAG: hypothetical protein K8R24_08740 [Mycobacterium sp.]|nr:hypothetical protein [Mycobacterium sp.]
MNPYYTCLSFDSVITALLDSTVITVAKDEGSVSLPLEIGVELAAETLRLLLDDERIQNHRGEDLFGYLGQDDAQQLLRILSRIGGPDRPTFTNC